MKNPFERPPSSKPEDSQREIKKVERSVATLDRLRYGKFGKLCRGLALWATLGVTGAVKGMNFEDERTKPIEKPVAMKKLDSGEVESLKDIAPDYVASDDKSIWIGYGGTKDDFQGAENVVEEEVIVEDVSEIEVEAYFGWGGRAFKDVKLLEREKANLKESMRPRIEELLAPYKEFDIEKQAIRRIVVEGDVFSSPEGHAHPEKNQKLSEQRAELIEEVAGEILDEMGIDREKVEFHIDGRGAQGDVLEFAETIERLGYKFRAKSDEGKRNEAEKLIRYFNEGREERILKELPKPYRDKDLVRAVYENTVSSKRRADLKFRVEAKNVHLAVKRDMPEPEKEVKNVLIREISRPEEFEESRGQRITEETAHPEQTEPVPPPTRGKKGKRKGKKDIIIDDPFPRIIHAQNARMKAYSRIGRGPSKRVQSSSTHNGPPWFGPRF